MNAPRSVPLSILDLAPIVEGSDAGQALRHTLDLARHAERLGYNRFWLAEHHGMPGIASAATSVVIGQVAAATSTIRVGAGGIMLPNHAPLIIAEQFGTLAALFPGRIDLGLGRAPGTDPATSRALRRDAAAANTFPQDVVELMGYFRPAEPRQAVIAVPGAGQDVPVWILGSSLFGAQLAAALGLPYAFASHFAPAVLVQALEIYRSEFQASDQLDRPYVMLGVNAIAAESDDAAEVLFTSLQQAFLSLRKGRPGPLPPPDPEFPGRLTSMEAHGLREMLTYSAVGSQATVSRELRAIADRTGADELILVSQIHDHEARVRSYELIAETELE